MTRWAYLLFIPAALLGAENRKLHVLPSAVELATAESRQQLLAELENGAVIEDWTRASTWTSSAPAIAKVDANGKVSPVADGEAVITAVKDGLTASVKVRVRNSKAPFTWSFRNHVIPVMTKTGCNQGACHGALAGKNGFKLTLRGYDPDLDWDALTRQSVGRRVTTADPAHSLLLLKPTFAVPHMGGLRFKTDSLEYRVISGWIAAGAPAPRQNEADVLGLEVYPANAILVPGAEQQLVVRAKYSDGRVEDVTHWVKYNSNNEGVASVDDAGRVKMNGRGESAITLYYQSKVLYARVMVPFETPAASVSTSFARKNFIDDLAAAKWKSLNLRPSAPSSDEVFIRRAYLDAAGVLPSAEEVENFLASKAADKRERMIDRLLERDEFVDYWAYKWSDLLLVSSRKLPAKTMWSFYNWIRDSVKVNKSWDQFANDIFTASGSNRASGALNYFVIHKDPIDLSENVAAAFLGQRLMCARCHNHPLEKWTQKQYYQMANLFSRVGVKNGNQAGEQIVFAKSSGDVNHPRLLRPLEPAPLDGLAMALDSADDRRLHFAKWLTDPKNPFFARSVVNRVWGNFMGRGLVHPIDDVRATNPASNEELLSAVTAEFVKNGFDVKKLVRLIMTSGIYQLSSDANAANQNDNTYYSKYIIKRLPAEVLLDSMSQVTGVPTVFAGFPAGTRAIELPDVRVQNQFLTSFGRPERVLCDAAERSSDPSIAQALHVINGDTLNKKLSSPDGYATLFLKLGLSDRKILDHMFLSAYSRYPRSDEADQITAILTKAREGKLTREQQKEARQQALEDMMWSLLTSKEFLFNY